MHSFSLPVRVYYEDSDAGGVVYHANYLKFMERCRTEWLRDLGFEQDELTRQGYLFVVKSMNIQFKKPAYFNDMLSITAQASKLGRASFDFDQQVIKQTSNELLCQAEVKIACLDPVQFRPKALPQALTDKL